MKTKEKNLIEIKDLNGKPIKFIEIIKCRDTEYIYILTGKKKKKDIMNVTALKRLENDYIVSVHGLYNGCIFDTELSMRQLIEVLKKINANITKYESMLLIWLNGKALSV